MLMRVRIFTVAEGTYKYSMREGTIELHGYRLELELSM